MVSVVIATEVTDQLVAAIARLVPQLSSSSPPPTRMELDEIVRGPTTTLFLACAPTGDIVGTLTLAIFRIPTGARAWIEDVVVDREVRGQGVGEALSEAAIEAARRAGAKTIELTSRPHRHSANRLYQRLGFARRDTNVYRFDLAAEASTASAHDPRSQE